MSKHLKFVEAPSKPKTKVWWVVNKHDEFQLGWIAWFSKWRKYAFFPKLETVYEEDCLRDIAQFCKNATYIHKERLKKEKQSEHTTTRTRAS